VKKAQLGRGLKANNEAIGGGTSKRHLWDTQVTEVSLQQRT